MFQQRHAPRQFPEGSSGKGRGQRGVGAQFHQRDQREFGERGQSAPGARFGGHGADLRSIGEAPLRAVNPCQEQSFEKTAGVFASAGQRAQGHTEDGAKRLTAHGGAALTEGGVTCVHSKKLLHVKSEASLNLHDVCNEASDHLPCANLPPRSLMPRAVRFVDGPGRHPDTGGDPGTERNDRMRCGKSSHLQSLTVNYGLYNMLLQLFLNGIDTKWLSAGERISADRR